MSTYTFGISGSWLLLLLFIIVFFALAWFSYRVTVPPVSSAKRWLLILLRTFALSLLMFAIFEPLLTMISGSEEQPKVAILFDNSESAGMQDALGSRDELFQKMYDLSGLNDLDMKSAKYYLFDSESRKIETFSYDSLTFKGQLTDISSAIDFAKNDLKENNLQAAILISDGGFNTGNNPAYTTDKFGKPIFTVGIGDTTEPKDISVQSIVTNETVFLDEPVPVNISLKIFGYNEGELDFFLEDKSEE